MKIIIGADLVPTESNFSLFNNGNAKSLLGEELFDVLKTADFRVFNLEVPLSDKKSEIKKCGPCLIAPTKTVKGYSALGVDLLTLANNHILDQGKDGLVSTLLTLKEQGIDCFGAGSNLEQASKPYILSLGSKKIGFYACAEHEFSIATGNSFGANPFEILESYDHVSALKEKCDYVIVLYHGGKEQYRYPSPNLQRYCRKFIEKGADLIICQHSHCIGCYEDYSGGKVIYGQGNFLFDLNENEFWNSGLLLQLDENFSLEYIPIVKEKNGVRLANTQQAKRIIDDFEKRSREIKDPQFVVETYKKYSLSQLPSYYSRSIANIRRNLFFKVVNKITKGKILEKCFTETDSLSIINMIECEAHRELFVEGLRSRTNENE